MESCLCGASEQRDDSLPFKTLVAQFDMVLPKLLVMLREDFELLNSGGSFAKHLKLFVFYK